MSGTAEQADVRGELKGDKLEIWVGDAKKWVYWAGSCGDAECDCRDVILYPDEDSNPGDDDFASFEELRVDPDSAVIRDEEGDELEGEDGPFIAALEQALTGTLLDALVRRWHADKGKKIVEGLRDEPIGFEDWSIDDLVAYEQLYEPLRMDDYALDGTIYTAMELYSANPAGDGDEVIIDFSEATEEEDEEDIPIGDVVVKLGGGVTFQPEEGEDETLRALWRLYERRYPTREHLRERAKAIRALGIELLKKKR